MTAHVIISGLVQGVGFRNYIKSKARKMGVKGWVTNRSDGGVEAELVGSKEVLDKLISISSRGPFLAKVKNIDVEWKHQDAPHTSFDIIR